MKVLVLDDEKPALDELVYLLESDERVSSVTGCDVATDAVAELRAAAYDAVFLDIAMPGLSGLDLAAVIGRAPTPPAIVFVTAHAEHAVEAFELHAVDYLLKPVRTERLREAVRRILEGRDKPELPVAGNDAIAVELGGVTRFVQRADVLFVEVQGDYSRLHTATGSHLVRLPISTLEERWREHGFVRIHRSFLVALPHVDAIQETAGRLIVRVGERELPVSRRLTPALREQLRRTRRGEG
ncbi:MAG TPA: LytTR family DNA-binding domain-containing protein [Nocardioides sp.]|nr:LytTR family DNA-binding domain-containing protein [Nocardioides sp.]